MRDDCISVDSATANCTPLWLCAPVKAKERVTEEKINATALFMSLCIWEAAQGQW